VQLTTQQLSGIIVALQSGESKAGGGHENRRFSRIEVHSKIIAAAMADGAAVRIYSVLTRDVSFSGMGLTMAMPCQARQSIAVCLPNGTKSVLCISCTVMHCRALADGIYGVGIEFTGMLAPDFIEKAAQSPELKAQRIRDSMMR
jgi:hypothetical protein